jgi:DNA polymerase-3 subunit epsilon
MSDGITLGAADTLLTARAGDFLAAGPADARTLIAHVCQVPAMPSAIAEHMALTLLSGHRRFRRALDGRWQLVDLDALPSATRGESPLDALSYVVVDVEATGTSALRGDRIIEIAAVEVHRGEARMLFETLVNPQRPLPRFVSALTHITWEMVKNAPTFEEVCGQLLGALEGRIFVAHNANFDWRFVSSEVHRVTGRPLDGRRICTVKLARKILPQLRRRSLDYVASHYGVEITARHRAGGDAMATAHVFRRMLRDVQRRGCSTLPDLEELLGTAGNRRRHRRRRPSALPQPVSKDTTA